MNEANNDTASVDGVDAAPPAVQSLPPSAGARAERRVRLGATLTLGLWLTGLAILAAGVATGWAATEGEAVAPAALPATTAPESVLEALQPGLAAQTEGTRARLGSLAAALAEALALQVSSGDPGAASLMSPTELREHIQQVHAAAPGLRLAIIDPQRRIFGAATDLPPKSLEFKSQVAAVLAGEALPAEVVGAVSAPRPDRYRVVAMVALPSLPPEAMARARELEQRLQAELGQVARAVAMAEASATARRDGQRRATLLAVAACALAVVALLILVAWPLRRSFRGLRDRAAAWSRGEEPRVATALPGELALTDALVAAAFAEARQQQAQARELAAQGPQIDALIALCRRGARGELSARVEVPEGRVGVLAAALNHLLESVDPGTARRPSAPE